MPSACAERARWQRGSRRYAPGETARPGACTADVENETPVVAAAIASIAAVPKCQK